MTTPVDLEDGRLGDEEGRDKDWKPVPRRRTLEEMLENTFASMALEGYELTAEERTEVRMWAEANLSRGSQK